jgi:glucose-1-phosphate cytidylyltransferase
MRVIILAGGLGTRISEETETKPKPMVLVGGKPILWHIMSVYASQGITKFTIATGYKGEVIHDWIKSLYSPWVIEAIDTGLNTQTGGRIKKCIEKSSDSVFLATYGDGLANVNMSKLIQSHKESGKFATLTAVRPPARFGYLHFDGDQVTHFGEKNQSDEGWINGGYFVLERKIIDYIHDYAEPFEVGALPRLVADNHLHAYKHAGFWQPMDTLREKNELDKLALTEHPPWFRQEDSSTG